MPIYEFRCTACGHEYEELLFDPDEVPSCPSCCCAEVERLMSEYAIPPKIEGPDLRALAKAKTPEMLRDTKLLEKMRAEAGALPDTSGECGSGGCSGCSG